MIKPSRAVYFLTFFGSPFDQTMPALVFFLSSMKQAVNPCYQLVFSLSSRFSRFVPDNQTIPSLTGGKTGTPAALASLLDRLALRLGMERILGIGVADSHLPELAWHGTPCIPAKALHRLRCHQDGGRHGCCTNPVRLPEMQEGCTAAVGCSCCTVPSASGAGGGTRKHVATTSSHLVSTTARYAGHFTIVPADAGSCRFFRLSSALQQPRSHRST